MSDARFFQPDDEESIEVVSQSEIDDTRLLSIVGELSYRSKLRFYAGELDAEQVLAVARQEGRIDLEFNPDQPRDESGKWTSTGGGGGASSGTESGLSIKNEPDDVRAAREVDRQKFVALKSQWARINDDLLNNIDDPDSPEARDQMNELKDLVKQMSRLKADPGCVEGIGLPGGPRDMVIVGAGPGGMTAAIMGGTDGLDTLLIDANVEAGGQAKHSSRVENFPGFPIGVTGERLVNNMFSQAERVGAETMLGVRVVGIEHDAATDLKTVVLSNGERVETRAVMLAGGVEFRKMDFPGANLPGVVYGDPKEISRQASGKPCVIVGGANSAAQAVIGCAKKSEFVTLLSRSPITKEMSDYQVAALRSLEARGKVKVIEGDQIAELRSENGRPAKLVTKGGKELDCAALGLFVGSGSDTKWLPDKIKRDDKGKVVTNDDLETDMPGVFAIGDMRHKGLGRIGGAVGDGQVAVKHLHGYYRRLAEKSSKKASASNVA